MRQLNRIGNTRQNFIRQKLSVLILISLALFIILRIITPAEGLNLRCVDLKGERLFNRKINNFKPPIIRKQYFKKASRIDIYGYIYIKQIGPCKLEIEAPGHSSGLFLNTTIENAEGNRMIHATVNKPGFYGISIYYYKKNDNDYNSFRIFIRENNGSRKQLDAYYLFNPFISQKQLFYFKVMKIVWIAFSLLSVFYLSLFLVGGRRKSKGICGIFSINSSPFLITTAMINGYISDVRKGLGFKKVLIKSGIEFERNEPFFIKKLSTHLLILLLFCFLVLFYMLPLVQQLDNSMSRSWHTSRPPSKDEAHDIYVTYWTTHNFHRGLEKLFTPDILYGQKFALAQSENYIGNLPISFPLSFFFHDPVALLNTTSLGVLILSLWGTYLLCYWFSKNVFASILASTVVNFYTHRLVTFRWLNLHSVHWFSLAILVFILLLTRKKTGYGLLFILLFFLQSTTNGYYGPILLCSTILITIIYFIFNPKECTWKSVLVVVLVLILSLATIYPIFRIYKETADIVKMSWPNYTIARWSSTIVGYLSTNSIFLGNIIGPDPDFNSSLATKGGQFPGIIFIIFFFYFLYYLIRNNVRKKDSIQKKNNPKYNNIIKGIRWTINITFTLTLAFLAIHITCIKIADVITIKELLFLILMCILIDAIYHYLKSGHRKMLVTGLFIAGLCLIAVSFGTKITIFGRTYHTLYYYFIENISFLRYFRGLSRLSLLAVQLWAPFIAGGTAIYLERIGSKNRKIKIFASIFLFAFIIAETKVSISILPVKGKCPEQYELIKNSKNEIVLLEIPIYGSDLNVNAIYHQLYHGKKIINGISQCDFPGLSKLDKIMKGFPNRESIDYVRSYGITHILDNSYRKINVNRLLTRLKYWEQDIKILGVYKKVILMELIKRKDH